MGLSNRDMIFTWSSGKAGNNRKEIAMRELEEILESVINAEPGKLANTVKEALEEIGGSARFWGFAIMGAAAANIDERLQKLEAKKDS